MGASKNEFMRVRMLESDFQTLSPEQRGFMQIDFIDVEEDYSFDELWNKLKSDSNKAFKALKKREFELRHNKK